ncbi:MAG: sulfatase-like hydrolase/transferase [Verrucomicrobia bacterium]|nr:sulfatase-like hydrolase/transferase [Verrucomicrobiota bacterium]
MKLKLLLLLVMASLFKLSLADATAKPNVILIMADDFGFEGVAANGGESYRTPNFDRLAATGMRFENCHVQPLCTPTRVQLMTGQYNVRNYVEFGVLPPDSRTFGNVFRNAGYATAIVGKWQLGEDPSLAKRVGFDEHCLWQFTRRPERYRNPGLEINGKEVDYTNGEYGPDIVADYALDFITRNKEKPFLLYYPMILTHDPFVPTPDSPDYDSNNVKRKGRDTRYFGDMVTYADKLVGRIADKLDELKIRENTLLIFIGDNGTHSSVTSQFRGKPYEGGKGKSIDTGTHVPLIANWPKTIPSGRVNSDLVDSTDFFPTICEAAGIKLPAKMTMDGKSFLPQLKGKTGSPRAWSYCWYAPRNNEVKFEFARDLNFKLYRDGTFFNTRMDPEEKSPLTDDSLSREAKTARASLGKVLKEYGSARPLALQNASIKPEKDATEKNKRKLKQ